MLSRLHYSVSLVFSLLSVAVAHSAQAQTECTLEGKPASLSNSSTFEGKSGIILCHMSSTGLLDEEQEVRDGKLIGWTRDYHAGLLLDEFIVGPTGMKQGVLRQYSATKPNNHLVYEQEIRGEWRVGRRKRYYPNGQLQSVEAFVGTHRDPIAKVSLNKHGEFMEISCADRPVLGMDWNDAVLCGHGAKPNAVELYSADRVKRERITFERGKPIREERFTRSGKVRVSIERTATEEIFHEFSESGERLREDRRPLAAKSQARPAGSPHDEQRSENGRVVYERSVDASGQLRVTREATTWSGREVQRELVYREGGVLASERLWSLTPDTGVPLGAHKFFDGRGKLFLEVHYDAAGTPIREKRFTYSGRLRSDDEVFADGTRKRYER